MCALRDVVVFFAGVETMHAVSHVFMHYYVTLPLHTSFVEITAHMNNVAIVVNAVVAVLLIVWAMRMGKKV